MKTMIWEWITHRIVLERGRYRVEELVRGEWVLVGTSGGLDAAEHLVRSLKARPRWARRAEPREDGPQDNLPRSALDGPLLPRTVWVGNG